MTSKFSCTLSWPNLKCNRPAQGCKRSQIPKPQQGMAKPAELSAIALAFIGPGKLLGLPSWSWSSRRSPLALVDAARDTHYDTRRSVWNSRHPAKIIRPGGARLAWLPPPGHRRLLRRFAFLWTRGLAARLAQRHHANPSH